MVNIQQLIIALTKIQQTFPNAPVKAEGWNDMGDLMSFTLRGDIRLDRDSVGNPIIVLR